MTIEEKYPNLYNFIGAWFPDSDFEELSDKEITEQFVQVSDQKKLQVVLKECSQLLQQDKKLLTELEEISNRYFEDIDEAESWLKEIQQYLQELIEKNPRDNLKNFYLLYIFYILR